MTLHNEEAKNVFGQPRNVPDLTLHEPLPDIKEIVLNVTKLHAEEWLGRAELQNLKFDVQEALDYVVVRLVQRLLQRPAEEDVVMAYEIVPANWWSHLIIDIVGGVSIPKGDSWRSRLLRRAKTKSIKTMVRHYRTCPHTAIPDNMYHLRWLMRVEDDAYQSYMRGRHG